MSYYIAFDTKTEFDTWHAQVKASLPWVGPNLPTKEYTYAIEGEDGKFYAAVTEKCPKNLEPAKEKIAVIKRDATTDKITEANGKVIKKG